MICTEKLSAAEAGKSGRQARALPCTLWGKRVPKRAWRKPG
jgi:hypothetical protein